jgi:acetylornithine deacetylase/succinyl-diaminopimelate desuccinylase-like protein
MRLTTSLNGISAVNSGQTAQVEIPRNRRLHSLYLFSGSDDADELNAKIAEIRVVIGTNQLLRLTIPQLLALSAYRGIPFADGELFIPFSDPSIRTPIGEEASALNLFYASTTVLLEIQYRTDAEYDTITSGSGGFTPALSGMMEYDFVNDGNRAFMKRSPITIPAAASGEVDHNTLPRSGAYRALHLFSAAVTRARVWREGVEILDRNAAKIAAIGRRHGLTPQTGHFPVDFAPTNQATDALEMLIKNEDGSLRQANSFELKLDVSSGGNLTAVVEQVVQL